ncbi:hypothetical protein AGMMS49525_06230 [Bacteroidia bacterium]|nr:hypothetical protein AGMMS49525_06230 [Bacteroidia bacterium]
MAQLDTIYSEEALMLDRYKQRVNTGIRQCQQGECISLEALSQELGYNYADL